MKIGMNIACYFYRNYDEVWWLMIYHGNLHILSKIQDTFKNINMCPVFSAMFMMAGILKKWLWLQEISKYWLLLFLFVKLIDTAIMTQTSLKL